MSTVNPTEPFSALRSHPVRTCHQLGMCLNPQRACTGVCQGFAMQPLAPGVIDGPYQAKTVRTRGQRIKRILTWVLASAALVALAYVGLKVVIPLVQVIHIL